MKLAGTSVVVFSKNRPWQLSEYIRTYRQFQNGKATTNYVIYYSDPQFQDLYNEVIKNSRDFKFVNERDFALGFNEALHSVLNDEDFAESVMFGTDDLFWHDYFNVDEGCKVLDNNPKIFGFSYRLHLGITMCHPANAVNKVPKLYNLDGQIGFAYNKDEGSGDWNYPFELGATLYRTNDILDILAKIERNFGLNGFCTPNYFEGNGSIIANQPRYSINACYNIPCCSVLTINRVQDTHANPVYQSERTLEQLNDLFGVAILDTDYYHGRQYDSIHIGEVKLINA